MAGRSAAAIAEILRQDMVVCVGGLYDGFCYFRPEWDQRVRAHQRMREAYPEGKSSGGLDYRPSGVKRPHPEYGGAYEELHAVK